MKVRKGKEKSKVKQKVEERDERIKTFVLTMVDEATSLLEIISNTNKKSETISMLVDSECFSRYPRPLYVINHNETEFVGQEFHEL